MVFCGDVLSLARDDDRVHDAAGCGTDRIGLEGSKHDDDAGRNDRREITATALGNRDDRRAMTDERVRVSE